MRNVKIQTSFAVGKEKHEARCISEPFTTAIIDPDWPYTVAPGMKSISDIQDADKKGRLSGFTRNRDESKNQYLGKPLSISELKGLEVGKVVGGYIFLWTVGPFLINGDALEILDSWGFTPVSILTWAKYNLKRGSGYGGVGYWFLGNAEFCIVAKRGGFPSIRTGRSSLFVEPKARHSAKPDNVHQLCEDRFPGPYLELFGRRSREGWTVLGNEAPGDREDIRKSLEKILK
jgi:N6-adenosine-specific RNA methylase IME4